MPIATARITSQRERTRLMKKLRRLERKFEKVNPDAVLVRNRLIKEASSIQKKLDS